MSDQLLEKINELAHKAKTVGLTEEEQIQRDALRKEYLIRFRKNMIGIMDQVYIKEEDGTTHKVERKKKEE